MRLSKSEMKKLRNYILKKKELLKIDIVGLNCSICYDKIENKNKKIIKLPNCKHIFHFKY